MQRYSKVTFHASPKTPISEGSKKIISTKIPILPQNVFLGDLFLKLLSLFIFKVLHEKSAQTDHFKEMWVSIWKGLKHVNTVIRTIAMKELGTACFALYKILRHFDSN